MNGPSSRKYIHTHWLQKIPRKKRKFYFYYVQNVIPLFGSIQRIDVNRVRVKLISFTCSRINTLNAFSRLPMCLKMLVIIKPDVMASRMTVGYMVTKCVAILTLVAVIKIPRSRISSHDNNNCADESTPFWQVFPPGYSSLPEQNNDFWGGIHPSVDFVKLLKNTKILF